MIAWFEKIQNHGRPRGEEAKAAAYRWQPGAMAFVSEQLESSGRPRSIIEEYSGEVRHVQTVAVMKVDVPIWPEPLTSRIADLRGTRRRSADQDEELQLCERTAAKVEGGRYRDRFYSFDGGRYYSRRLGETWGDSLQTIPTAIRHACLRRYLYIDVVNSHPSILDGLTQGALPDLHDYVVNRDAWLGQLASDYGIDRESAKKLVIMSLYGADLHGDTVAEIIGAAEPTEAHRRLTGALDKAATAARRRFPELEAAGYAATKRRFEREGKRWDVKAPAFHAQARRSWTALICQSIEKRAIDALFEYHLHRGEVMVLPMHDGYYVDAASVDEREVSEIASGAAGVPLRLVLKR